MLKLLTMFAQPLHRITPGPLDRRVKYPVTIRHRTSTAQIYARGGKFAYYRLAYTVAGERKMQTFAAYTTARDAAGRLWGIDYPSGASVRYQLDLLSRIIGITNMATSGGSTYVTRYQYDAVGNITNVIDPFNGNTSFVYDGANRRSQRTLPNGVLTTWQYNWKDQVTNITHKISGTTLASVLYELATGGEPTKITREDSTYVTLQYDSAFRLTNEIYYSSGGVPQTTNSYAYDAAGSRIKLVQGGLTLTNSVTAGYQITAVKNATNGSTTNSYAYDTGGRVTQIVRDGATLNLGYNSSDQVAAVTNGAAWVTYRHDANGRRTVSTNSAGTVRRLLVASTPGSDLESPHLIANASGTVQQGYVYLGDDPILRYTTSGTASYYLEDGMGSVIGLAPASSPSTANTTRLFYDGFGNGRGTNGPAPTIPTGTGGDFRFQGAWLETDSGLYNMRAREYDARMGRFTSRDPVEGDVLGPETRHPYTYANNNAAFYSDPTGLFTILEIDFVNSARFTEKTFRAEASRKVKEYIKDKIHEAVHEGLARAIERLLPADFRKVYQTFGAGVAGLEFGKGVNLALCKVDALEGMVWRDPYISVDGEPKSNGFDCDDLKSPQGNKYPHPDFVLSSSEPKSKQPAYVVGEAKWQATTLRWYFYKPQSKSQWRAITAYAREHTYSKTALFITFARGDKNVFKNVVQQMKKDSAAKGINIVVIPLTPLKF